MSVFKLMAYELLALLIYMSLWFVAAYKKQRLDLVDTAWGGGYIVMVCVALMATQTNRTVLIRFLVIIWGVRLAVHILHRNTRKGPDPRYEELSAKWNPRYFWQRAYLSIFILQGLIIFVVGLPITVAAAESSTAPAWLEITGTALWVLGFTTESIADSQLSKFIRKPSNKGRILQTGLWRYSRHPNYFGELLQWWAIGVLALGTAASWLGLLGPLLLTWLIIFISGIPPMEKKRQNNPQFQTYKRQTSPLIPWPPKT